MPIKSKRNVKSRQRVSKKNMRGGRRNSQKVQRKNRRRMSKRLRGGTHGEINCTGSLNQQQCERTLTSLRNAEGNQGVSATQMYNDMRSMRKFFLDQACNESTRANYQGDYQACVTDWEQNTMEGKNLEKYKQRSLDEDKVKAWIEKYYNNDKDTRDQRLAELVWKPKCSDMVKPGTKSDMYGSPSKLEIEREIAKLDLEACTK